MARAARSLARDESAALGWLSYSRTLEESVFVIAGLCVRVHARPERRAVRLDIRKNALTDIAPRRKQRSALPGAAAAAAAAPPPPRLNAPNCYCRTIDF